MVENSDKTWSTGEGKVKPLQHASLEKHMNSMKRQKRYNTGKGASPGWKVCNMLLGKSGEQLLIAPERNKWLGQSENDAQLCMHLLAKVNLML